MAYAAMAPSYVVDASDNIAQWVAITAKYVARVLANPVEDEAWSEDTPTNEVAGNPWQNTSRPGVTRAVLEDLELVLECLHIHLQVMGIQTEGGRICYTRCNALSFTAEGVGLMESTLFQSGPIPKEKLCANVVCCDVTEAVRDFIMESIICEYRTISE